MKSNLHKNFKTNSALEEQGVFFQVEEGVKFLIARFSADSEKVQAATLKYLKPYVRQIQSNQLSAKKRTEISVTTFVHACVIGWEGVTDAEGNLIPFSKENCIELLLELPELFRTLEEYSSDANNYKDDVKEELGNS